jgi:hypothetical protein
MAIKILQSKIKILQSEVYNLPIFAFLVLEFRWWSLDLKILRLAKI